MRLMILSVLTYNVNIEFEEFSVFGRLTKFLNCNTDILKKEGRQ